MEKRVPERLLGLFLVWLLLLVANGCQQQTAPPPPPSALTTDPPVADPRAANAPVAQRIQVPAAELKTSDGQPRVVLPVAWVIEGGRTEKRTDQVPLHDFELSTNIQQPLDYGSLPQVYVSHPSLQVVVRRGQYIHGFDDPTIGERLYPAYMCLNPNCPGIGEKGTIVLFPFRLFQKHGDLCPYCLKQRDLPNETAEVRAVYRIGPYYLPQYRTLEQIMFRQHYAKRAKDSQVPPRPQP